MINKNIIENINAIDSFDHERDYQETAGWLMAEIVDHPNRQSRLELMIVLSRLNKAHTTYKQQKLIRS